MEPKTAMEPGEYARLASEVASDKQASDIVVLDIRKVSDFADYFLILTAESVRQINALGQNIENALEAHGATLQHREGRAESGWMLLDFSDVIVHLFDRDKREFYNIEDTWTRAIEMVRIQ